MLQTALRAGERARSCDGIAPCINILPAISLAFVSPHRSVIRYNFKIVTKVAGRSWKKPLDVLEGDDALGAGAGDQVRTYALTRNTSCSHILPAISLKRFVPQPPLLNPIDPSIT